MASIPDQYIDAIICDLPYGTTRNKWDVIIPFEKLWEQYKRIIKGHGIIILFGQGLFTAKLMESNIRWWRYNLIWHKTQPTGFLNAHRMPLRAHEDICVFYKNLPEYHPIMMKGSRKVSSAVSKKNSVKTTNYGRHNLIDYDSDQRFPTSIICFAKDVQHSALHPTQKPVALIEWLVETFTKPGSIVLDNCSGSGTTAIACLRKGRKYICFESEATYYKISIDRINNYKLQNNLNQMTKVILFASRKGGTGKSTLCAMVANHLAGNGMKVALIDCDNCSTLTWRRKSDIKVMDDCLQPSYSIYQREDYFGNEENFSAYDYVLIDNLDTREHRSDIIIIPFIYSEMVLDSTFRFVKDIKGEKDCEILFLPNEVNGFKQSIKKKDVIESINWILGIFGKILPKVPNSRLMDQVNTIGNTIEQNILIKDFVNKVFPECPLILEQTSVSDEQEEQPAAEESQEQQSII